MTREYTIGTIKYVYPLEMDETEKLFEDRRTDYYDWDDEEDEDDWWE